jgi:hypothetical protein
VNDILKALVAAESTKIIAEWRLPLAQSFLRFFARKNSNRTLNQWFERVVGVYALASKQSAAGATQDILRQIVIWQQADLLTLVAHSKGTRVNITCDDDYGVIVYPMLTEPSFHEDDNGGNGTRPLAGGRPHKYVSDTQKDALDAIQGTAYVVNPRVLCAALDADERGLFADQEKRSFMLERRALEFAMDNLADGESYWLPCFVDWRGRIYTDSGAMLSYQGSDLHRGLCWFAEAREVSMVSEAWAEFIEAAEAEYGVTMDNYESIIAEGITDVTGNQFRRLACAIAFDEVVTTGKTGYIWQQDATCSGMGHIAAIMGDARLAKATALLGKISKDEDLYTITAKNSLGNFHWRTDGGKSIFDLSQVVEDADVCAEVTARGAAKSPVMLSAYGSRINGMIRSWMIDCVVVDLDGNPISKEELDMYTKDDLECIEWDQLTTTLPQFKLTLSRARALGATPYLAFGCIANAYRKALMKEFPCIEEFQGHMSNIARKTFDIKGRPSAWRSSVGMLCVSAPLLTNGTIDHDITTNGVRTRTTVTNFSNQPLSEDKGDRAIEVSNLAGQAGYAPSRIHSEDASVVVLSVLDAADQGIVIAPIHDSWGSHISNGLEVRQAVRDAMVTVHSQYLFGDEEAASGVGQLAVGDWDVSEINTNLIR